jgi:hypothetical protein
LWAFYLIATLSSYLYKKNNCNHEGPWPLPQNFNGPYHKPNGPFFTCIFRFWKLCNRLSLYFSCQLSYTLYKTFYFHLSKARAKVNTAINKSTDHGNDINPCIEPESETQMSESNNKTTETESERFEHHKYRQVSEKLWPWLTRSQTGKSTGYRPTLKPLQYHKPNGPFFTCNFRFWKLCKRSLYFSYQFAYTLYKTFYFLFK